MKNTAILLLAVTLVASSIAIYLGRKYNLSQNARIESVNAFAGKNLHPGRALFDDPIQINNFKVSRPAGYKNLQVYLLTGTTTADERHYTTLQHALENKMATVRETGNVNELKIDNFSSAYIYINSGDIVKGGRQDRTIQYDVIIPPQKKDVDLASFCVEHGRWTQRENESDKMFETSSSSLSSKDLKIAAKQQKSQQQVWAKVSEYQEKTNTELKKGKADSASIDVRSVASESSLQLSLDNKYITEAKQDYRNHLAAQLKKVPEAAGLAYCINGKLYSIELFNNHRLFADLFDKLLDAAIAEAISEEVADTKQSPELALNRIFEAPGKVYEDIDINELTRFQSSEAAGFEKLSIFTTIDKEVQKWLHRNWLDNTND